VWRYLHTSRAITVNSDGRNALERVYTIGEAAAELGMPASTIRYYDKNGLFPDMSRSQGGIRVFTEDDLEWARFVERLKVSGMPIREIKEYIDLYRRGNATIAERLRIVRERREKILRQMEDLRLSLDFMTYKCWFYEVAAESGTCDTPRNMPSDELPEEIRRIKQECRINRY
jgi:DNA-binding transcriptional MerR regulator